MSRAARAGRIVAAAIRFRNSGEVRSGPTHYFACGEVAYEEMTDAELAAFEEGFLTEDGRFVDRLEAARIVRPQYAMTWPLHTGDAEYPCALEAS